MRVLGIGAHPDDLEILCGGTLAKYAQRGDQVFMCHVTQGEKGHFHIPSDELARTRAQEAREAAAVIGAEAIGLGLKDGEVEDNIETQRRIIDVIRQTRPDVIITHAPEDRYLSDYASVGKLVIDASFHASVPYVQTEHPYHDKIPPIYYMETIVGVGFVPTLYVDITDTFEAKKEMLARHRSQLVWLKEHDNVDELEIIETVARFRGWQCGVAFAEGFNPCLLWPRIVPGSLLP